LETDFELNETIPSAEMEKSTLVSPTTVSGNFSTTLTPTNGTLVDKYGGAAIAFVTGSKTGMIVGIVVAIVIVIIIALCIRQAIKGLKEAKERALIKLGALIKKEESVEFPDAALDMELAAVQPATGDKKKLENLGKIKFSLAYDEEQ